jgi:hypothetical protein
MTPNVRAASAATAVVYMAAPGTPDYDAMVLLDMAGFAAAPEGTSHDPGLSNPR